MTPEAINLAIAESVGWMFHPSVANTWRTPEQVQTNIRLLRTADGPWSHPTEGRPPNYHGSLDACAEFEATLSDKRPYIAYLVETLKPGEYAVSATASQRSTAYVKLIGKWRDE